jgi:glucose-6-phosphate isomerase, archaeal
MHFDTALDITPLSSPLGFRYGSDVFGPEVEHRKLDAIRPSLLNPACGGPETVYAIAMDVGRVVHRPLLAAQHLLFGVVTYAAGRLGDEPVRSQGHIHKISPLSGWSTPEVYEIWSGRAIILMQEYAADDPGRCFAVEAGLGEVVVVPPGWAHATISADPDQALTFGAWCDRAYGFEYSAVRAHRGLAWYPLLDDQGQIGWLPNENYFRRELVVKKPEDYGALGLEKNVPIYRQYEQDPDRFLFVPHPMLKERLWHDFVP